VEEANFCAACGAALRSPAIAAMIEDARRAISRQPDDASARYNLALAYKLAGTDELALAELVRVVELAPDFADAHYEIALLKAKSGRMGEAEEALSRALELDPEHAGARRLRERLRRGT